MYMLIDIPAIHDLLVYLTRIAEFKSKENYIPFLTFYKAKYNNSIERTLSNYFQEPISIDSKEVTFDIVTSKLFDYLDFLDSKETLIGSYKGPEIIESIKEEFATVTEGLDKLEWSVITSEFMLSFSVTGDVYVAKSGEDLLIFDFGFSD
jgi:hypothetical protein